MAKVEIQSSIVTTEKAKYQIKNWANYNKGLVKRGSLTLWIEEGLEKTWHHKVEIKRGGQKVYSDSSILMVLTLRSVFNLPFRQTAGFAQSLLNLMKIDLQVPCYTQICRRQAPLKVPPRVSQALKKGENIFIVVDSSGLKVYGEGEWNARQHGIGKRRTWRKIHLGTDEKSGEIVAQVLTKNDVDDAAVVPDLLKQAAKNKVKIDRFAGDGAYDKRKCYDYLTEKKIAPIIPRQTNANYWLLKNGEPDAEHPRNLNLLEIDDTDRKQWKIKLPPTKPKQNHFFSLENHFWS